MKELDEFGKLIAEDLRDAALNRYLDIESGAIVTSEAKSLNEKLSEFSPDQKELVRTLITKSIDTGIHDFLYAIEASDENIKVVCRGRDVVSLSDGLNGEIFTEDGWFEKYSQHKESGI